MKVVMGLSGGMDSATLLGLLINEGHEVHCSLFNYGSKHNKWENAAALHVLDYYKYLGGGFNTPSPPYCLDLTNVMREFKSALLSSSDTEIPEGHYAQESMRQTVVPGRNTIFASIMLGIAETVGAGAIALGVHAGDHHIYPDCRKEYVKALDTALYLASDRSVQVWAPLIDDTKTTILQKGYDLAPVVPYHLTRTCYKDQPLACGKCGACNERLEAFSAINRVDPIEYGGIG